MFGEIELALSLWDRFKKKLTTNDGIDSGSVSTRFVTIFENHGVHRNQIPRFFGHGLTISDIKDDETLLNILTEDMLDDVCEIFSIRREWLDGADPQLYPIHDFYKSPEDFAEWLIPLKPEDHRLHGVLMIVRGGRHEFDALVAIEEPIGELGKKVVYRYHLLNNWIFSYWKSRAYLTACVAIAWNNNLSLWGIEVSIETIKKYSEGQNFLEYCIDDALPAGGKHWYPEDMAISVEAFLDGIDPELNNYGIESGLSLWLSLYDDGYMGTNLGYQNVREAFQSELEKYDLG